MLFVPLFGNDAGNLGMITIEQPKYHTRTRSNRNHHHQHTGDRRKNYYKPYTGGKISQHREGSAGAFGPNWTM